MDVNILGYDGMIISCFAVVLKFTAFFAIVVKTGLFLIFFRLLFTVLSASLVYMQPLFVFVTCGSLLVGTFGALKQIRIKRFIAYASISQVGFILIGLSNLII